MDAIVLFVIACLPHSDVCRSLIQRPAPLTQEECDRRAIDLQRRLVATIDDGGYVPRQVTCLYGPREGE